MLDDYQLVPYNGFLIGGSATIQDVTTRVWRSLGTVYSSNRSPVTEIKRIEGALFRSREDAMKAGLEVAKKWVDEEGINQRQKMNVSLVRQAIRLVPSDETSSFLINSLCISDPP
jgi:hypothetical protein